MVSHLIRWIFSGKKNPNSIIYATVILIKKIKVLGFLTVWLLFFGKRLKGDDGVIQGELGLKAQREREKGGEAVTVRDGEFDFI